MNRRTAEMKWIFLFIKIEEKEKHKMRNEFFLLRFSFPSFFQA